MVQHNERNGQVHLYLDDTYRFTVDTVVIATGQGEGEPWIALQDNIFHPQGGGQPADAGWVDGVAVTSVRDRTSGMVVLVAAGPDALPALPVGAHAHAALDREVRLRHAALHTAGHLVEALVRPREWVTESNNHFPGQSRVEFTTPDLSCVTSPEDRAAVTAQLRHGAREAITAGLTTSSRIDADGSRTVTIDTLHTVACGGTHVATLAELRDFDLPELRVKKGRIKASYSVEYEARLP
jgi:Ser-tRNA(Ala) deacylase AlaX